MFTGIVEDRGVITGIEAEGTNKTFWISSPISDELTVDQSVAHNGVCLTIEELLGGQHKITAIAETLAKTTLNSWAKGDTINLERCLQMNGRLDGHIVQGHVDAIAKCIGVTERTGSWEYTFSIPKKFASLIIEKGSITINGISLTLFNVSETTFQVAIIPYTFEHTNIQYLKEESEVNIEFDMVGKYINRYMQFKN